MRINLRRLRIKRKPAPKRRSHRPLSPRSRALIKVLIVLVILAALITILFAHMHPVIAVLAKSEAREFVIRAINGAIDDEIANGGLDYNKLVTLEKDTAGNITALITNSVLINNLQTRISNGVVNKVENMQDAKMSIPIGNAIGGVLLHGRGPGVPVKVQSITNVQTRFANDFTSTGINQTRHKLMLEISAEVTIVLPGGQEKTTVVTEVAIAETVIVGVVPNVYADIWK